MIVGAAVVPHPPVLLPGLTGATVAGVEQLRNLAQDCVRSVGESRPDLIIAVGGADETRRWPRTAPAVDGFLGRRSPAEPLPLSLSVLVGLLDGVAAGPIELQAVAYDTPAAGAIALGAGLATRAERVALVVAGDGSARRGPKAPGYEDPRAEDFDAGVAAAIEAGDVPALAGLDASTAHELLVAGRSAWQVLAGAVGDRAVDSELMYAADPFGVYYLIARWRAAGA